MLRRGDFLMIQNRINEGAYVKDIACELNVSPKTVSRALKRGGAPTGKPGRPSTSKLDLFKPQVDDLLYTRSLSKIRRTILKEDSSRSRSKLCELFHLKKLSQKKLFQLSNVTIGLYGAIFARQRSAKPFRKP